MERGNYFTARPFADPNQRTLEEDLANIIDAGVSAAAKARPYLKNFVQNLTEGQQQTLGSVMNQLPASVNLLGRYYTGLKDKNLDFSDKFKQGLGEKITEADENIGTTRLLLRQREQDAMFGIRNAEENLAKLAAGEKLPLFMGRPLTAADMRFQREQANHQLAYVRSKLKKIDEGNIIYASEAATDKTNPLESVGTSVGSAYFKRNPEGSFSTTDKYDFTYANADQKHKPFKGPVSPEQEYKYPDRPSLGFAREAAEAFLRRQRDAVPGHSLKDVAGASPAANIGRSLVSRFEDDPFSYTLTVPNTNQSK